MILLLHAYSRANLGDGMLVDETLGLIRRAFPDAGPIVIGASHAESFADLPHVVQIPGVSGPHRMRDAAGIAARLTASYLTGKIRYPVYDQLRHRIKLVVGIGGGYLRSGHCIESMKMMVAHFAQLRWATTSGIPTFYLPQSIGPFRGPIGFMLKQELKRVNCLCLRDDRSLAELNGHANLMRAPDLSIMQLFHESDIASLATQVPHVYLIARDLVRPQEIHDGYVARLKELRRLLPDSKLLVQSSIRSNDDTKFYQSLGWEGPYRALPDVMEKCEHGVVISVRLHGSLQALLGQMPSIHLAYERKGYGAFQDLAMPEYVHSATRFDPAAIAAQVKAIQANPQAYWSRLALAGPHVRKAEQAVIEAMRKLSPRAY